MSHSAAPCESPSPIMTPGLTDGRQTIPLPLGSQLSHWPYRASAFLPAFSRLSRKLHDRKPSRISACEMLSTNTPESSAYFRSQTSASLTAIQTAKEVSGEYGEQHHFQHHAYTVKTRIIEPCAMSLELPPLVRSGVFCFFYGPQRG